MFDAFHDAAFGAGSWTDALEGLAEVTGSRVGELIGLGSRHSVPFNWVSGMSDEWVEAFLAIDGGNPEVNPYVRAGSGLAELEVQSSEEFVTREERRSNRFINEHCVEFDIPYACLSPLVKTDEMLIGLAVLRGRTQGEITADQRRVFEIAAPHVRAAVRSQLALEHQGGLVMAAALEALTIPAFVCDRHGRVRALTPEAERAVGAGRVHLRHGVLAGATAADTAKIAAAIGRVAGTSGATIESLVARNGRGRPLALQVLRVPGKDHMFSFDPRVLVVLRERGEQPQRVANLLRAMYDLTPAEVEIVRYLLEGKTAPEVADARGVTVATARTQIKLIYAKFGVRGFPGLVALVNRLT